MIRLPLLLVLAAAPVAAAPPPPVTALAYRPDGQLLAAGTRGVVHLIDPAKGEAVGDLAGQTGRVTALAFSRSGWLAVASGEPGKAGVVRLYEIRDLKTIPSKPAAELAAHADTVYALAFSPDGRTLATAGYDKLVKLWDVAASAEPAPRLTLTDHSDAVYALDFHPEGKLLASGSADRAVKVWDVVTGRRLYTLSDPTDWVYAVAWSPDGKHLAAGGVDRSVRVWEAGAAGGNLVRSVFAHGKAVSRLAYSADGKMLVSAGEDRAVKLWDAAKLVESKTLPAQPSDVLALAVRPDGKQVAVGRFDGAVQLLDPASGKATATPIPVKPKPAAVAAIAPDHVARGQTLRVRFDGDRLDTVTAIRASVKGVEVAIRTEGRSRSRLEADMTVPVDAPVGPMQLVLASVGGDSNAVRFWIDRFPAIRERGMTDSARNAMPVKLPATVVGTLDRAGDIDFFRFEAEAGQEVGVQVTTAADRGKFDPIVVLTDESGQVLAEGTGGRLGFTCPEAGTYSLGIRDRDYRGGGELEYRLHVGPVPVVTGVFPLGVTRGAETSVTVLGVNLGELATRRVTVRPPADAAPGSKFPLPIDRAGGDPVGPAEVTVGEYPGSATESGRVELTTLPATVDGILRAPGEAHLVKFRARKGERLIVETHADRLGSPVDTFLEVLDADGRPVPRAVLRCTAKTYVTFRDHNSTGPGIRLEYWNELAIDDFLYVGGELMRIRALPRNPDDDCQFYEVDGKRVGFLDTTPTHHALGTPMYRVEVHPPGSNFPPNGMPLFELAFRNDDGGPGYGRDSRIFFDPPADGIYQVRVSDAHRTGGPTHAYRVTVRPPRPDFTVRFNPTAPKVWRGGAVPVTVTATRIDGFDGPIDVRFDGLPAPFRAPAGTIEARQHSTSVALFAGDGKVGGKFPPLKVVATAVIDGREVVREAVGSPPAIVDPGDLVTTTNVPELVIRPGAEARMVVKIERRNGHTGRVPLDVLGLPHGVRVLNIGLNGILVLPGETEREIVLYAEPWVRPMERPFVILSRSERKNTEHAAPAVLLKVRP
jgi:DNA-binding beta-propeller fold protein YncE